MYELRFGGYAPAGTTHQGALRHLADVIVERDPRFRVQVVDNVMDQGRPASDLLTMVADGELTLCYFSTTYLAEQVPALGAVDAPFRFRSLDDAHAALDGGLGRRLSELTEAATPYRVLGYWDNGFRHLTNRLREVRTVEDCAGLRVRLQPSVVHARMLELWGCVPVPVELSEGIQLIKSGAVDAQENPLENTVTYGVDVVHPFVSVTSHVYGARGLYAHRPSVDRLPSDARATLRAAAASAVALQRRLAVVRERELAAELDARPGTTVSRLSADEVATFERATRELTHELREEFGPELMGDRDVGRRGPTG